MSRTHDRDRQNAVSGRTDASGPTDASGTSQVHFHYDRSERLKHRSAQVDTDHDQRRRKLNRRLIIIVLDILLVSVVYLIFLFFLQPDHSTASVQSVRFSSQANSFDESLLIRVTAERQEQSDSPSLIQIRVIDEQTSRVIGEDLDTLGQSEGDSRRFHLQLEDFPEPVESVVIQIEFDENDIELVPTVEEF
ncbi:MAG: hypothetical protein ACOC0D_03285 [Spirochaeta sp.]